MAGLRTCQMPIVRPPAPVESHTFTGLAATGLHQLSGTHRIICASRPPERSAHSAHYRLQVRVYSTERGIQDLESLYLPRRWAPRRTRWRPCPARRTACWAGWRAKCTPASRPSPSATPAESGPGAGRRASTPAGGPKGGPKG
eukprot:1889703-Pyramimonas_sp.AAC.1